MITFVKIARYELNPKETDVYSYLADLVSQKIDPPSLKPRSLDIKDSIVLHSTLQRSVDSLLQHPETNYVPLDNLREIRFDLEAVCPREIWNKQGSTAVRRGFAQAFVSDTLIQSRDRIADEVHSVCELIQQYASKQDSITVLSHSFRMKVFEAYIHSQGILFDNPELIHEYLVDTEHTYDFGTGFEVSLESVPRKDRHCAT